LAMINIIFNDRSLTPEAKIKFLAQGLEQESSANEFCLKLKAKLTNLFGLNPRIFHAQFFNKEAISVSEILSVTRNTFTSNQEKAFSDKLATQLSQILFDQFNSLIQTAQNLAGENPDYYYGLNILAQNMIFLTSALDTQAKLKNLPNLMITTETGAKNLIQAMEERISFVESKARELGFNLVNLKPILLALNGPSSMQKMSQLEKELDLFRGKSLLELNEMVLPTHDLSRVQFKY